MKITSITQTAKHDDGTVDLRLHGKIGHKAFTYDVERVMEGDSAFDMAMQMQRDLYVYGETQEVDRYNVSFIGIVWEYKGIQMGQRSGVLTIEP